MAVRERLGRVLRRCKQETRDLVEFVLLPGLAGVLPWRWCWLLFQRMAHWSWLYGAQCQHALAQAQQRGCCDAPQAWLAMHRLTILMDHADHYLVRLRSAQWALKQIDVQGSWPAAGGAQLLWTFHWGMGMQALRHARAHGMQARMVLAAPQGPDFAGRSIFARYVRARMRTVEQVLGGPIIFVPGGMQGIRDTLAADQQVVVVMDVPQDQVAVTTVTTLLGQPVSVPAVLPRMAVAQSLPVTVFYAGLDFQTGRRTLHIAQMGVHTDPQVLTDQAFAHFDRLLHTMPAAWHLWGQALRFFVAREKE